MFSLKPDLPTFFFLHKATRLYFYFIFSASENENSFSIVRDEPEHKILFTGDISTSESTKKCNYKIDTPIMFFSEARICFACSNSACLNELHVAVLRLKDLESQTFVSSLDI